MNRKMRKSIMRLSGVNMLLGLWIMISPFVLGFHQFLPAVRNNTAVGVGIAFFALLRLSSIENQPVWSWCNTLLGLWLIISPFLLGFAHLPPAMLNNLLAGALVQLLAYTSAHVTEPRKGRLVSVYED